MVIYLFLLYYLDMGNVKDKIYMCANIVAENKEKAIIDALNNYFGRKDWTESDVAELVMTMDINLDDNTETLHINLKPMIEFSLMTCNLQVETGIVRALYHQSVKPLYG